MVGPKEMFKRNLKPAPEILEITDSAQPKTIRHFSPWTSLWKPLLGSVILAAAFFVFQASNVSPQIPGIAQIPGVAAPQAMACSTGSVSATDYWESSTGNTSYSGSRSVTWHSNIITSWCYTYVFANYNGSTWHYLGTASAVGTGWISVMTITAGSDGYANSVVGNSLHFRSCNSVSGGQPAGTCSSGAAGSMDNNLIIDTQTPGTPTITYPTTTLFTNVGSGTVTWAKPSVGPSDINAYYVNWRFATPDGAGGCYGTGGNSGWYSAGSSPSWVPGWGANTCFQFQVYAVSNSGIGGSASNWSAWVIMDNQIPTAGGHLNATCFVPGQTVAIYDGGSGDPAPSSGWPWGGGMWFWVSNGVGTGWTSSGSWGFTVPTPGANTQGTYYAQEYIRDNVGNALNNGTNQSNPLVIAYNVDNTSPANAHVSGNPAYTNSSTVVFSPSATAGGCAGITDVQISNDGSHWVDEGGINNYNIGWDFTNTDFWGNGAQGTHTVYIKFNEGGNANWAQTSFSFVYDYTAPTGSLNINSAAAYTGSTAVTLNPSATDTGGSLTATMRFSNDNSTWGDWVTYATSYAYTLPPGEGNKTVYVQYKDNAGNPSGSYSHSIILDTTAPTCSISYTLNTKSTAISLTLAGTDTGGSGLTLMSFESENYYTNLWSVLTAQVSYSTSYAYTLPVTVDGLYDIRAHFQDAAGNTSYCDGGWLRYDTTAPTGSININSGASATKSIAVNLNLSATDPLGVSNYNSGLDLMTISNDNATWSSYAYSTGQGWTLSAGDGIKTVYVKFTDKAGNVSSVYSHNIILDTLPPTITWTYPTTTLSYLANVTPFTLTWTEVDTGSGVATRSGLVQTATATNNTCVGWTAGTVVTVSSQTSSPVTPISGTCYRLALTATDGAGNTATVTSNPILVDSTAPAGSATITAGTLGNNNWYKTNPTVTITGSDLQSGVASLTYRLDGGSLTTYTTPFVVTGNGTHVVAWTVTNNAGLSTGGTLNFQTDAAPPVTTITCNGATCASSWYTNAAVTVVLSGYDANAGVLNTKYTLNGGGNTTYSGAISVSAEQVNILTYWSTDLAGNIETTNTINIKIDHSAPTVMFGCAGTPGPGYANNTCGPSNWFVGSPVTVTLSGTDAVSGLASLSYQVDGGSTTNLSSPPNSTSFTVSGDGKHTISLCDRDVAGNQTCTGSFVYIDSAPAPITYTITPTSPDGLANWYVKDPAISLSTTDATSGFNDPLWATDNLAGLYYQIDGASPQKTTSLTNTIATSFSLSDGNHTVIYWTIDAAHNTSSQTSVTVKVDTIRPHSLFSANNGNLNTDHLTTIPVSLSSSDAGSGTANSAVHFSIDGGLSWGAWLPLAADGSYSGTVAFPNGASITSGSLFTLEEQVRDNAGNLGIPRTGPSPTGELDVAPNLGVIFAVSPVNAGACSQTVYLTSSNKVTWPTEQSFCLAPQIGSLGTPVGTNGNGALIGVPWTNDGDPITVYSFAALTDTTYLSGPTTDANGKVHFTPKAETAAGVSVTVTFTANVAFWLPSQLDNNGAPKLGEVPQKIAPMNFTVSGLIVILNSGTLTQ
jgi:hypothetical protein